MRTVLLLVTFGAVYLALQVGSNRANSATFDEPVHLAAGYLALTRADYGFDSSHPPFLRMWAALPLLAGEPRAARLEARRTLALPEWSTESINVAGELVYGRGDGDAMLGRARLMVGLLGVALGLLIFLWVRAWVGEAAAAVTLVCYTIAPNLGAHAGLVTTDLGLALFYFGTAYFLWRLHHWFSGWNLAGACACFALALASKFSAVILGPVAVGLLGWAAVGGGEVTWRRAGLTLAAMAAAGYLGIWAVYQFQYLPSPDLPPLRADLLPVARERTPLLAAILGWVDAHHLLPAAYSQGFIWSQASAANMSAFLAGEYRDGGWWYYFPAVLLLKTPVMKLALMGAGIVFLVRQNLAARRSDLVFVLLPPLVFLGAAMASDINIGVRHVLPVNPFGFLLAAVAVQRLWNGGRWPRLALTAVLGVWLVSFGLVYPHTLAFFNLAAGGSAHGPKWLADSNLDWGQGLKALKTWMTRHGVEQVNFAYFGTIDPRNYGINYTGLPTQPEFEGSEPPRLPGYVVVSPTVQALAAREPRLKLFYAGLEEQAPVAVVGHALRIYWVEEWPLPAAPAAEDAAALQAHLALADTLLAQLRWPDLAARLYQRYLAVRPADSDVTASLALALDANQQRAEAIAAFARAVDLDANPGAFARNVAMILVKKGELAGAEDFARKAIALDPRSGLAHEVLGVALALQRKLPESEASLVQSLRLDPGSVSAAGHLDNVRAALRGGP
jgi:4-amino-4-deoxy-L-arabinose transferase-like glycosyltransferase